MQPANTCVWIGRYSRIEGFQEPRTVIYTATAVPEGICLTVQQESETDPHTEACICPTLSLEQAGGFLQYICENSVGIGNWCDILLDAGIPFRVCPPPLSGREKGRIRPNAAGALRALLPIRSGYRVPCRSEDLSEQTV